MGRLVGPVLATVLFLLMGPSMAATIARDLRSDDQNLELVVSGTVVRGDAERLQAMLVRPRRASDPIWLHVWIDSDGGSILEAMRIGRFLRSQNAGVIVDFRRQGVCRSSCVLVLMGGVVRSGNDLATEVLLGASGNSRVGIHRPYLSDAEVGQDFEETYRVLRRELEAYFDEMHVSKELLELMYSVPPEEMRVLSNGELAQLLPSVDPVYDEKQTTAEATRYGLTNSEYRARRVRSKVCLQRFFAKSLASLEDVQTCEEAIMRGR
jgi:hypothetical protein